MIDIRRGGVASLVVCLLLGTGAAVAQDPRYIPIAPLPLGDALINLPTPRVLSPGMWEVRFTHRFAQPVNEGDVHSLWGLDSSSDVAIGLAWAPVRDLQLSILRSNVQDDIELAARFALLKQAPAFPLSISLRGGVDWRTERGLTDRTSLFAQVILAHQIGRRIELFVIPTYASDAGDFEHAFNVPIGVAYQLQRYLSLIAEVIPENRDARAGTPSDFAWAVGLKRAIGGHYFEVLFTNSRATHVDQYLSSTFLGGLDRSDVHLGFNIERRFGGRRR
ncbi:MAG TPA: DUF5777 family beta-barrel protein [Thermoanaerobaculia bacterium]|nr:DUF5777 family beta-barrel protein [Thermoanaerobaculia bacterium]